MSLLLDTNVLLWWLHQPARLTDPVRDAVTNPTTRVRVSVVSGWEIAIKLSIRKLEAPPDVGAWLPAALLSHRFLTLPIELRHVVEVEHLPFHHADPFDRLLIAQARVDGLTIATGDPQLQPYGVPLLACW